MVVLGWTPMFLKRLKPLYSSHYKLHCV